MIFPPDDASPPIIDPSLFKIRSDPSCAPSGLMQGVVVVDGDAIASTRSTAAGPLDTVHNPQLAIILASQPKSDGFIETSAKCDRVESLLPLSPERSAI